MDTEALRQFLVVFGISMVRLTAACSVVPFMGNQLVQGRVRNSVLFSWGVIIYPIVSPALVNELGSPITILGILAKEVFIGILIGFLAAKVFWIAMSIGFFIDNQRGASMASVFDPMSGDQTSPVGQFLQQTIIVLFYSTGGFLIFLGGMFESYLIWPIDSFYPTLSNAFPGFVLEVADDMMVTIVVLASPIVITIFLTDFGLGLVNRFAPQLNVFFLSMPIKSVVALFVLILYLPFLLTQFGKEFIETQVLIEFFWNVVS